MQVNVGVIEVRVTSAGDRRLERFEGVQQFVGEVGQQQSARALGEVERSKRTVELGSTCRNGLLQALIRQPQFPEALLGMLLCLPASLALAFETMAPLLLDLAELHYPVTSSRHRSSPFWMHEVWLTSTGVPK